ncbi:unnamed protein product, partial [Symbiodinium necroappetens]
MITKADGQHTVTVEMLQKAAKIKASCRTILRALHDRAPHLLPEAARHNRYHTGEYVRDRFKFAKKYRSKTGTWWANRLDAFMEGSTARFTSTARSDFERHSTAPTAVTVHEVVDGRWSDQAAASFYRVLARDLAKVSPGKHKFTILEDSDPTGHKSANGITAKRVNKRLRKQEIKFPKGKKETRASYVKRLKLTIRSLQEEFLLSSIKDMARIASMKYRTPMSKNGATVDEHDAGVAVGGDDTSRM